VRQGSTPQASAWDKTYDVVIWWATPVEVAGALAKLLRIKHLDAGQWRTAVKLVTEWSETWSVIPPTASVRAKAIELVEHYDLRAADALQLAAALEWCDDTPSGRRFLTTDRSLRDAAVLCGFDT